MQLLKIGNRIINADYILSAKEVEGGLRVLLAVSRDDRVVSETFDGEEATALRAWLEQHVEVVFVAPAGSPSPPTPRAGGSRGRSLESF